MSKNQKSILFIGNFLSSKGSNQGIAKELDKWLTDKDWRVLKSSSYQNRFLRLLDMIFTSIRQRGNYQAASIDLFSGQAFIYAEVMTFIFNLLKKPVSATLRGGHLAEFAAQNPKRVTRVLVRLAKATTPSIFLQEYFSIIRKDILRIPNGIDLSHYQYYHRQNSNPKIVWLRALHKIYAPWIAIEVLYLLRNKFPHISMTLVGPDKNDGSLERVKLLIDQYKLQEAVLIVGGVEKKQVPCWLNQGDIFINTTRIESFGVSVLEAAACGLPIVTTDAGELPYMWEDGVDALVVPVDDANAMAKAVERILTEPELAAKLSANARKKAERYDWFLIMPQWEKLFTELIKENNEQA